MRALKLIILVAVLLWGAGFVARMIYAPPDLAGRSESTALPPATDSRIARHVRPQMEAHPGKNGVAPLQNGALAFAARILLARSAETSIDAQYYIWQNDITGILLLAELQAAAERGVRVRLLVDDNGTPALDAELAELDSHPNAEVRLFNSFILRSPRVASYMFDFRRLNRRMHNKSFTVDGIATIVGGRNVGDIYFATAEDVNYFDLDVLVAGNAAAEVGADFDGYWASQSAFPVSLVLPQDDPQAASIEAAAAAVREDPAAKAYLSAIENTKLIAQMMEGSLLLDWVETRLVSDDPVKGLGPAAPDQLMITRLFSILGRPTESVDLVSAYFVPGEGFTDLLAGFAQDGIRVRTLTNSQAATDVLPVHGGYIRSRDDLLEGGVEVYELKAGVEQARLGGQLGLLGYSTTSLHAKTFVLDRDEIFVGSFNFDPRSANLNTEMGFLIDSEALARTMAESFDSNLDANAYRVRLSPEGAFSWQETAEDGHEVIHTTEPATTLFGRALVTFMSWLPIAWML
ncbi:phospholipase D family protein [Pseudoruegeria sp. SHC-113]|uniref:phospholipase D family protein n=1 Tax=Pseudoruegeria sp. SHC-113 TaxID=2855439 RepID=UPI0021BBA9C9|nr:phospholipase D family protein [Pseudoruegeria sp. SHC-113]MCT8159819.1 phospholipase D family protein [Pseudoruegeria sp. SHC-113]